MPIENLVAVVTGASRGLGRGIAVELGRLGARVYVVGRTQVPGQARLPGEATLPGTIHDAAEAVTAAGGHGIAVSCDLSDSTQIARLFKQVGAETGHLHILVNNAAFIHDELTTPGPFWEKPLEMANILDVGLRCHYEASWHAARLMVPRKQGLIVNISFFGAVNYFHGPAYGVSKAGLDKMAADMAIDLAASGIAAVSLWPGIVTTERVLQYAEHSPEVRAQLPAFESPGFTGRVIGALHADPKLMELSGKTLVVAELATRYGLRELDGRQPASLRNQMAGPHPAFS